MVPTQRICEASDFFDRACNGKFKEGLTRKIHLPEITPSAFDSFVGWLYTGKIRVNRVTDPDETWWISIVDQYILAAYLQCWEFGNRWISFLCDYYSSYCLLIPPKVVTEKVYASTVRHCGLQRLLAATGVWSVSGFEDESEARLHFSQFVQSQPAEYIIDVMTEMRMVLDYEKTTSFEYSAVNGSFWDRVTGK